jgi:dipeptidase E
MKKIIIASTSTVFGSTFLEYLKPQLIHHFNNVSELLFVPYARPGGISHEAYTEMVQVFFESIHIKVKGLHSFENPIEAVATAQAIFTGGGNTFVLVNALYQNNVIQAIANKVNAGTPYLGTSAGSNICGLTMCTTNDMPIVYPKSFKTFGFVPFNINPHYLDPEEGSTHMGETRETRIKEFHFYNSQPVVGLREGSWIEVLGKKVTLKGNLSARLFLQNQKPVEVAPETDWSDLK